jgi:hypothetical protein
MPMPIEVNVSYTNGSSQKYYIPLEMMRWEKENNGKQMKDWAWGFPTYDFEIKKVKANIQKIEIDSSQLMADVNRENNVYEK